VAEKQPSEAAKASTTPKSPKASPAKPKATTGTATKAKAAAKPAKVGAATKPAAKKPETAKPAAAKARAPEAKAKAPAAKKPQAAKKADATPAKKAAIAKPSAKKVDSPSSKGAESVKATGKTTVKASGTVAEAGTKSVAADAPPAAVKPAAKKPPPFVVGDKVVYPHHGAATITAIRQMEFQGEKRPYYVLEVATDQLVVSVPVDGALELGVRPVISTNVARKVFATFREEPQEAGANWSRWYKLLTEKINSGDIFQVAEVVRDLTYAQQVKGISPALKRMLAKARLIIVSELRFALKLDEEDAIRRLDRALPRVDEPVEL
jgi:CarD family transcriptional regulator